MRIALLYGQELIPHVDSLKYLGIIYISTPNWSSRIEYVASKGLRAIVLVKRISNDSIGMCRRALLMTYRIYVHPILELDVCCSVGDQLINHVLFFL